MRPHVAKSYFETYKSCDHKSKMWPLSKKNQRDIGMWKFKGDQKLVKLWGKPPNLTNAWVWVERQQISSNVNRDNFAHLVELLPIFDKPGSFIIFCLHLVYKVIRNLKTPKSLFDIWTPI